MSTNLTVRGRAARIVAAGGFVWSVLLLAAPPAHAQQAPASLADVSGVVQHADAHVTVLVVPRDEPGAADRLRAVVDGMRADLDDVIDIRCDVVGSIPHERGKTRDVVSEVVRPAPSTDR